MTRTHLRSTHRVERVRPCAPTSSRAARSPTTSCPTTQMSPDDGVDIAARVSTQVRRDGVRHDQPGVRLEEGWTVRVPTRERLVGEVDPHLVDAPVDRPVGDDGDGQADRAVVRLEVDDHLLEAAPLENGVLDVLDRGVVVSEPGAGLGDERPECGLALDPPADWIVHLGLDAERRDQRVGIPGQQTVEVGHRDECVPPTPVQDLLQCRRREQLGGPRHGRKRPTTAGRGGWTDAWLRRSTLRG